MFSIAGLAWWQLIASAAIVFVTFFLVEIIFRFCQRQKVFGNSLLAWGLSYFALLAVCLFALTSAVGGIFELSPTDFWTVLLFLPLHVMVFYTEVKLSFHLVRRGFYFAWLEHSKHRYRRRAAAVALNELEGLGQLVGKYQSAAFMPQLARQVNERIGMLLACLSVTLENARGACQKREKFVDLRPAFELAERQQGGIDRRAEVNAYWQASRNFDEHYNRFRQFRDTTLTHALALRALLPEMQAEIDCQTQDLQEQELRQLERQVNLQVCRELAEALPAVLATTSKACRPTL